MRDMDIAAEIIGISPLKAKLSAFAVSSFYCGIAGALWAFLYTGTVEPLAFEINQSFKILFMTVLLVLRFKGITPDNQEIMSEFMGVKENESSEKN